MNVVEYLPDDSQLRRAAEAIDSAWGGLERPAYLVLPGSEAVPYHDPDLRRQLRQVFEELLSEVPAAQDEGPYLSWLHDLEYWENGPPTNESCPRHECPHLKPSSCPDPESRAVPDSSVEFYAHLQAWRHKEPGVCEWSRQIRVRNPDAVERRRTPWVTAVVPKAYGGDDLMVFRDGASGLRGSRLLFTCRHSPRDPRGNIDTLHQLRQFVDGQRVQALAPGAFVWADWFSEAERDENVLTSSLELGLGVLCSVSVVLAILLHPLAGPVAAFVLSLVVVQVLGLLALFGVTLDFVTFMVVCMAAGFAIEYVVHIAHSFMLQDAFKGPERMAAALEDMGFTVFSAFLSTAVQQIVLLIFADSYAFIKFCLVAELVVVLSGLAGFLVVPGMLTVLVEVGCPLRRAGASERS